MTEDETSRTRTATKPAGEGRSRPWTLIVRQVLAFALETAFLFAVTYWAITAFPSHRAPAAVVALALSVVLWSLVLAPRAKNRLPWPALPLVAGGAFLAGAGALMVSGLALAAVLVAAAAVVNLVWDLAAGYPAVASAPRRSGRRAK
ncbi:MULTISPECIES: DUF2568 domain-containing protein [Arthrobacter]|uniref:YrdB family protein n=1 Tax=Arthrobacter sunyaminii TaxID=2816859 RepID=A0A975PDJ1_9MICC|nr:MULTISPECIES: DUF2568 domain-containing protein [Arthrobacter]MBO0897765.1 YrdB family protein [Arthrobacter sunyaminii]MBO0909102.1 YrdB family protein [Arthrobacter sunyaminii]QWQ35406.1 YrdB family protein [Arthrobacter sunyaminii]